MTALPLNFICKPVLRLSRLSVGNLRRYMTMAAVMVLSASAQQPEDLQQQLQQLNSSTRRRRNKLQSRITARRLCWKRFCRTSTRS